MKKNEVVNYPIQGSAFHCLLWSFIRLDEIMRKENWDTRLIGQIHDSIIMDVNPDELDYVKQVTTRVATEELPAAWKWINVPLSIDIDEYGVDQPWI
jgi:DNA polymerase I-like protein with 3'-5' exonuclease and polymerase domains